MKITFKYHCKEFENFLISLASALPPQNANKGTYFSGAFREVFKFFAMVLEGNLHVTQQLNALLQYLVKPRNSSWAQNKRVSFWCAW